MALNQEEIRIKAGLDYSGVTAGIQGIRNQVNRLANDVPKKLFSLLKANVFIGATSLLREVVPSFQEIWDKIYNTGPDAVARSDESNQNFRTLLDRMMAARKALKEAIAKADFEDANQGGKYEILQNELKATEALIAAEQQRLEVNKKLSKYVREPWVGASSNEIEMAGLDVVKSETTIAELEKKRFADQRAIEKFQKANAKAVGKFGASKTEAEFDDILRRENPEVFKSRWVLRSIVEALRRNPNDQAALDARDFEMGIINNAIQMRSIKRIGGLANQLGVIGQALPGTGFSEIKESLLAAQTAAMQAVIQKVRIVEIDE